MSDEKIAALLICERIADKLLEFDLCKVYGGEVDRVNAAEPHYKTSFCLPMILDACVKVYSPSKVAVSWQTSIRALLSHETRTFGSAETALEFIKLAFTEFKLQEALNLPHE